MHRRKQISILISILLLSFITKGQQQDGSVLERRITINQQNQTLDFILEQISWQARVYFSYDASIIDSQKKHTIEANNKSLYNILKQLLPPKSFDIKERENQIIITKNNGPRAEETSRSDTIPSKYFFLSGKLIGQKKGRPVKYASVSVLNKPIGTISNTDGEFLLKLQPDYIGDTIIISSMGYAQLRMPASTLLDEDLFILEPVSIRIKEIKITSISAEKLLNKIHDNYKTNYTRNSKLMTAFYRETVKQDGNYISVSEAVMEVLKSPYVNTTRSDLVRLLKGRKSPDVQPFRWLNFKLQGGPFTITKLDIIKTIETFIDPKFESVYNYEVADVIRYNDLPVYVLKFQPVTTTFYPAFEGIVYVHRETFAIVHARYRLSKPALKQAEETMIKRKPRKVKARPSYAYYHVNYRQYQGKWHLAGACASVKFKVKSKRDKINSEFHSVSDLLITDIKHTDIKRFTKNEKFTHDDIFVDELGTYDGNFWENYNIIKPNEDLRKAFKNVSFN